MWRDVAIGFATWVVSISLLVGTWVASFHFFGPPNSDRDRAMAFIGGGILPLFILLFIGFLVLMVTPIGRVK